MNHSNRYCPLRREGDTYRAEGPEWCSDCGMYAEWQCDQEWRDRVEEELEEERRRWDKELREERLRGRHSR